MYVQQQQFRAPLQQQFAPPAPQQRPPPQQQLKSPLHEHANGFAQLCEPASPTPQGKGGKPNVSFENKIFSCRIFLNFTLIEL